MCSKEKEEWKKLIIERFYERLSEFDPQGNYGKIPRQAIIESFKLEETLNTKDDAESLFKELLTPLNKSPLEMERGSINHIMHELIGEYRRPTGLE